MKTLKDLKKAILDNSIDKKRAKETIILIEIIEQNINAVLEYTGRSNNFIGTTCRVIQQLENLVVETDTTK